MSGFKAFVRGISNKSVPAVLSFILFIDRISTLFSPQKLKTTNQEPIVSKKESRLD